MVYHSMGDEDVERIMRYPNTAFASDGGIREFGVGQCPIPRSYGTNARVLAEYVREKQRPDARRCDPPDDFAAGAHLRLRATAA